VVIRVILLLIASLLGEIAVAVDAPISYSAPTTYTDGTPLPANAITGYEFRCGTGTTTGVSCVPLALQGTALGGVMVVTVPVAGGTACVEGRTLVAAGPGPYSSPPACKLFPPLVPSPPGNVTVAVVIGITIAPVYSVTNNGRVSTLMGFIDLGKSCGDVRLAGYRGADFYAVAPADVRWWAVTTTQVAAPCAPVG